MTFSEQVELNIKSLSEDDRELNKFFFRYIGISSDVKFSWVLTNNGSTHTWISRGQQPKTQLSKVLYRTKCTFTGIYQLDVPAIVKDISGALKGKTLAIQYLTTNKASVSLHGIDISSKSINLDIPPLD